MFKSVFLGAMATMTSATTPTAQDNRPIAVEETGVAVNYEATKKFVCGEVEWYVDWKSGDAPGKISGSARVTIGGKAIALSEFQTKVLDRLASVDDVSATCNQGADGAPVRTALLIAGNAVTSGARSLAQVRVDPGGAVEWAFDPA